MAAATASVQPMQRQRSTNRLRGRRSLSTAYGSSRAWSSSKLLSALLLPRDSVRTLILYLRLGVLRSLAVRMDGGCEEIARPLYEAVYADGMPQKWRIARRQPVAPYQAPLLRSCYKSMQRTAPVCLCFRND